MCRLTEIASDKYNIGAIDVTVAMEYDKKVTGYNRSCYLYLNVDSCHTRVYLEIQCCLDAVVIHYEKYCDNPSLDIAFLAL